MCPKEDTCSKEGAIVTKLMFVYNVDSGILSMTKDYIDKVVRPSTYGCNLCALTYDNLGLMKKNW